jgi:hypothetical protein
MKAPTHYIRYLEHIFANSPISELAITNRTKVSVTRIILSMSTVLDNLEIKVLIRGFLSAHITIVDDCADIDNDI